MVIKNNWCSQMCMPSWCVIRRHLHWWLWGTPAIEPYSEMLISIISPRAKPLRLVCKNVYTDTLLIVAWWEFSYLWTSAAVPLSPLHDRTIIAETKTKIRKRVRVRKWTTARIGGSFDFADFHVMPPFGANMAVLYKYLWKKYDGKQKWLSIGKGEKN